MERVMKLWIWNWQGGGYNYCKAKSRKEALAVAKSYEGLLVNESSLHMGTWEELERIERSYSGKILIERS